MRANYRMTAAVVLLLAQAAWGQTQPRTGTAAPAEAQSGKVAVLDVRNAIVNTAEGKLASAELQSALAPRQGELANIKKQIDDGRAKLDANTGTPEERAQLARRMDLLQKHGQRKLEEVQEEQQAAENDVIDRVVRKMKEVIDRYARENGYAIVLDAGTACGLYCSNQLDITQDIIRLYDQANPVRGAAPTPPQPGQPRPQPGQQRPPATQPPKPPRQ